MRSNRAIKILVFVLILTFYGSLLVHKIELPAGDDIARHIKNGELISHGDFRIIYSNLYTYTEPEHPFVNHNWLFGVSAYLLLQVIGWNGLVIFKTAVFLLAFSIVFIVSVKKSNFWLVSVLSLPAIMILMARTTLRPEMFSFLFVAIFLYLLNDIDEHPQKKRIYWLIPIQLIWVNIHLFFIVGIALTGGFLGEKIIFNYQNLRRNPLIKKLALLLLGLIGVSFINPNGWEGVLYPFKIFGNYGVSIVENYPPIYSLKSNPPLDNIPIRFFQWSVVAMALSFLFSLRNRSIFYFLAGIATAIGGFKMIRLISFFGLIFIPAASLNLKSIFERLEKKFNSTPLSKRAGSISMAVFIIFLCYLIFLGSAGKFSNYKKPGLGLTASSDKAGGFFIEHNLRGPIFNDFDFGSYLVYRLYPQEKIFVDNRPEAHSEDFLSAFASALESEDQWKKLDVRYDFNALLLNQYSHYGGMWDFIYNRINDPEWKFIYLDSYMLIFLRDNHINGKLIREFEITSSNAETRLETLLNSSEYDDRVAAADVFNLLGRPDLSKKTFLKVVQKWPDKGKIWLVLGRLELIRGDSKEAVMYLERVIEVGHRTSEAYYYLSLAYKKLGEDKKAEEALKKALKINPDYLGPK